MDRLGIPLLLWAVVAALRAATTLLPGAGNWEAAGQTPAIVQALVVERGSLLAAGPEGLFESRDQGDSWSAVPGLEKGPVAAVVADGGRAFAAGPDALWERVEGRWISLAPPTGGGVTRLALQGSRLLAATGVGLFARPLEAEGSWERLWPPAGEQLLAAGALAASGGRLLIGTEDGVVEVSAETPAGRRLGPAGARILGIAVGGGWVHIALGGPGGGLARAAPGSDLWQRGSLDSGYATAILADKRDSSRLYAGLGGQAGAREVAGVVASEDAGLSWAPVRSRLLNSFVLALALDPEQGALYAAAHGGGVYRYREPTPLRRALETARPLLEVADPLLLGLAAVGILLRVTLPRKKAPEPGSPPAT